MMRTEIHLGIINVFIFLGVFQGIFLSWFFIKNSQNNRKANLYQGLLMLFLSLIIFEEWLNNTGYIVRTLYLTNFSEPYNFVLAPLLYIYVRTSLKPNEKIKAWPHFIFASVWFFYMVFQYIQPDVVKYNDYVNTKHPGWEYLDEGVNSISSDPVGFRQYTNELTAIQLIIYISLVITILFKKFRETGQSFFNTTNEVLIVIRNTFVHFFLIFLIFMATKLYFGMGSDVGGYFIASYISFMMFASSYQVMNRSDFFSQPTSFLSFPL